MLLRGARFEQLGSLALVALAALIAACSQAPGATNGNQPPTISGTPPTTVVQGATYEFVPSASDPDGDALTFGIDAKPSWGVFDTSTGRLSGTPGAADVGVARGIVISVSDGHSRTALPAFDNCQLTLVLVVSAIVSAGGSFFFYRWVENAAKERGMIDRVTGF